LDEKNLTGNADIGGDDENSVQKLLINNIFLGPEAKEGEFNVVEVIVKTLLQ